MMDFETLWSHIRERYSNETSLKTTSTEREFNAVYDGSYDLVLVTPLSTKMPRHITRRDFQNLWDKFMKIEGDPYRTAYYQRDTRNASYILAMIKDVLEQENVQQTQKHGLKNTDISELKRMKGSLRGVVKYSWYDLEELTEKFIKEAQR